MIRTDPTFDYEMSLSLEVFGGEFDLARLRQIHVSDGEGVDSTSHAGFHLHGQKDTFH